MNDDGAGGRIPPVTEIHLLRMAACDRRLSRGDVGVYAVLLKHAGADLRCFPGQGRISSLAQLAKSNVQASLAKLAQLGYLTVHNAGQGRRNTYQLSPPDELALRAGSVRGKQGRATDPVGVVQPTLPTGPKPTLRTGYESTLEITSEITGAARPGFKKGKQKQEEQSEELQRRVDWIRHQRRFGMIDEAEEAEQLRALQAPRGGG